MSRTQLHGSRYRTSEMDQPMDEQDSSNDKTTTTSAGTTANISRGQTCHMQENIDGMQLNRSEMNELIMDYLVHEGFKEAAERFREEAGIDVSGDFSLDEMMDRRVEIRHHIEEGDILRAKSLINLNYPELLDNHKDLYFKLQQQHLIELIRQQKVNEVLSYVHEQLSVDELGDLGEMERVLALLAYENPDKSPYASLLKTSHRLQLASEINDIILQDTTASVETHKPRLVTLLKLVFWTEDKLERKKIPFTKMTDLVDKS